MIAIKIKRFDKTLPLPAYHTEGSVGFDLYARQDTVIPPGKIGYAPLNIAVEAPEGYFAMLVARSSTHTHGVMMAHGIGIGDRDFCGDGDEYRAPLFNFTAEAVTIPRGTRIAQMLILPGEQVAIQEVEGLSNKDRGGFGSTGHS